MIIICCVYMLVTVIREYTVELEKEYGLYKAVVMSGEVTCCTITIYIDYVVNVELCNAISKSVVLCCI